MIDAPPSLRSDNKAVECVGGVVRLRYRPL